MSSNGVMKRDIAGVAICSVLYRPMKLLMCLTLEIFSSLVFRRELLLCGDTSRNLSLQIHPFMSTVMGNIIVLLGSILRLARKSFSRMRLRFFAASSCVSPPTIMSSCILTAFPSLISL